MNRNLKFTVFLFLSLLLLNYLNLEFYKRFDLTKDKRYTLSDVSLTILNNIDEQVVIRVYLEGDFPTEFKRLQIETRQFLEELRAENSNINIRFVNPNDQREQLIKAGMTPSQLTVEENGKLSNAIIFPWAEIEYKNKRKLVSLLPTAIVASQENQFETAVENLEFSFATALQSLSQNKTKKVAVLAGNGELEDIKVFSFLSEVSKKYRLAKFTLDSVAKNPQKVLKDLQSFDLAIIAKPTQAFSENEKLVLDQFIMNGGGSLWMLENVQADTDSLYNNGKMLAYPRDLNLTDLLFSYGVRINNVLVKDLYSSKISLATGNIGNQTQFQNLPWFFHPLVNGNPYHPITKNTSPVRFRFANPIDTLKNSIKKTPLFVTSPLTRKVGTPSFIELQSISEEPKEQDYQEGYLLLGVLLEGKFKSAYKGRILPFNQPNYQEQSVANKMIVIGDGDVGRNQILKGKPFDLGTDKWTNEQFGNKEFLLNAVDFLLDDTGLIDLRNKTLQINILDKEKAFKERSFWQFINVSLPLILLAVFGVFFTFLRKKKYTSNT